MATLKLGQAAESCRCAMLKDTGAAAPGDCDVPFAASQKFVGDMGRRSPP
jgi:hypothetical protein